MYNTCRAVIDKGTLDAIASGGVKHSSPDSNPAAQASTYLLQMWHLLRINGLLIIVSTMPPSIFDILLECVIPLTTHSDTDTDTAPRDSPVHPYRLSNLKTKEGGDVFYYAIVKSSMNRGGAAPSAAVTPLPAPLPLPGHATPLSAAAQGEEALYRSLQNSYF
jgi:hypothetical protein